MNHLSGTSKHYTKPSESGLLHKAFRISASSAATGFSHPQNIIRKWVLLKARAPCPHGFLTSTDVNTYQSISFFRSQFDGFQNRGTVIIHFNGIFHHKPTSYWGYPHFWKPPLTTVFHGPLSSTASPVSNGPIDKPTKFNHDEVRIKCQKVLKQKKTRECGILPLTSIHSIAQSCVLRAAFRHLDAVGIQEAPDLGHLRTQSCHQHSQDHCMPASFCAAICIFDPKPMSYCRFLHTWRVLVGIVMRIMKIIIYTNVCVCMCIYIYMHIYNRSLELERTLLDPSSISDKPI